MCKMGDRPPETGAAPLKNPFPATCFLKNFKRVKIHSFCGRFPTFGTYSIIIGQNNICTGRTSHSPIIYCYVAALTASITFFIGTYLFPCTVQGGTKMDCPPVHIESGR